MIILGLKLIITLSQFTITPVILIIYGYFWTDVFEVQGFNNKLEKDFDLSARVR